jgi:PAS domain S-box-containing protein
LSLPAWLTPAHARRRPVRVNARRVLFRALALGVGFALLLAIPFALYYRSEARSYQDMRLAEKERVIRLASEFIHQEMEAALSDLRFLARLNETRALLQADTPGNRRKLGEECLELARQKRLYDQVRLIGMDGREKVRVDFVGGRPRIAADTELQYKGARPYFIAATRLGADRIHVSDFDLNIEHEAIELPIKPVIRFAMPVADNEGRKQGILVLNYLGQRLLDRLAKLGGQAGALWLIDARGYWLLGSVPGDTWGFMFPGREARTLSARHPALWQQIARQEKGVHVLDKDRILFERVHPLLPEVSAGDGQIASPADAGTYHWTVVSRLPHEPMRAAQAALPVKLGMVYGILVVFGFILAGGLSFLSHRNAALAQVTESVIDNLPVLIAYVDAEQRYRFNNLAYERLFGLNPRQLFGKSLRELLGEAAYQEIRPFVEQALAGQTVVVERRLPYERAGWRDVVISYTPDAEPDGRVNGFFVMIHDVTPIKESERRERQRTLELAHVSRLASLGEMASQIAHEVNQPLAAISMYSAACLRTLGHEDGHGQIESWLEAINTQAKRASEVVQRLRRFVRKGDIQPGPVDLNQVVKEVVGLTRFDADRHGVGIELELADGMPTLSAELILVEQVLFNLVRNAVEALARQTDARRIVLRTGFDASQAWVEVEDSGPGVDAALGETIFESFMTDKRDGLGMGLAISRSIVEAHGGALGYVNNPEGGATFRCSLPREVRQ